MTIQEQVLNPFVGEIFEGYEIDLTPTGSPNVFHLSSTIRENTVWQGNTYSPFPIQADGGKVEKSGAPSRINLNVSNISKLLLAQISQYGDLVGANVTRWRTFKNYLDGQVDADPNQHFPVEKYVIIQKQSLNEEVIQFVMSSKFDRPGLQLPRRQILRDNIGSRGLWAPGVSRLRKF